MTINEAMEKEVLRFKMELIRKMPFYGEILVRVPILQDLSISTACTNGREIRYNPVFLNSLVQGQRNFVLMHEIFHILLLHGKRDKDKDPRIWNVACDYVVNAMLCQDLRNSMNEYRIPFEKPKNGCYKYLYQNESAEELYYEIMANQKHYDTSNEWANDIRPEPETQTNSPSGKGKAEQNVLARIFGINKAADSQSEEMSKETYEVSLDEFVKRIVSESLNKSRGLEGSYYIPASILRIVESKLLPWRTYLKGMLEGDISDESSYLTPERKYLHMDLIVPGSERKYDELGQVWAFVDSSGSVGEEELNQFFTQLYRIIKDFECEMNIAYWDTSVTDVYKKIKTEKELYAAVPKHSGGTDINCVYQYMKENRIKPEALVILTDGYFGRLREEYVNRNLVKNTILVLSTDYKNEDMKKIGKIATL